MQNVIMNYSGTPFCILYCHRIVKVVSPLYLQRLLHSLDFLSL
jgi:hypothetical protein